MSRPVRVVTPGRIACVDGQLGIIGWTFTSDPALTREEMRLAAIAAVRTWLNARFDSVLGAPVEEDVVPISLADERAAEMEAYMLIDFCRASA